MSLNLFPGCLHFNNRNRRSTLEDKLGGNSRYHINNISNNELDCYKIDGCIRNQNEKCDYLLVDITSLNTFLIELKGSDLLKAISQIDSTINLFLPRIRNTNVFGRIVLTKVYAPDIRSSKYLKLRNRLKALGGTLEQGSNNYFEEII